MPKVESPHQTSSTPPSPYAKHPTTQAWTQKDKARLYDYVLNNRVGDWDKAAACVPGKSAKQCRDHWVKTLGPYIKKTCNLE